jgi:hypothetical protein
MTDKDIFELIIHQMEEEMRRDELLLSHIKYLHRIMGDQRECLGQALELVRLPAGPERDALSLRIENTLLRGDHPSETSRLLARHESLHERRGGLLARLRERIEGL